MRARHKKKEGGALSAIKGMFTVPFGPSPACPTGAERRTFCRKKREERPHPRLDGKRIPRHGRKKRDGAFPLPLSSRVSRQTFYSAHVCSGKTNKRKQFEWRRKAMTRGWYIPNEKRSDAASRLVIEKRSSAQQKEKEVTVQRERGKSGAAALLKTQSKGGELKTSTGPSRPECARKKEDSCKGGRAQGEETAKGTTPSVARRKGARPSLERLSSKKNPFDGGNTFRRLTEKKNREGRKIILLVKRLREGEKTVSDGAAEKKGRSVDPSVPRIMNTKGEYVRSYDNPGSMEHDRKGRNEKKRVQTRGGATTILARRSTELSLPFYPLVQMEREGRSYCTGFDRTRDFGQGPRKGSSHRREQRPGEIFSYLP